MLSGNLDITHLLINSGADVNAVAESLVQFKYLHCFNNAQTQEAPHFVLDYMIKRKFKVRIGIRGGFNSLSANDEVHAV